MQQSFRSLLTVLVVFSVVSAAVNVYFMLASPLFEDDDALFPGLNYDMAAGPDMHQQLWHSFLFVIESESAESGYELWAASRDECKSFTSYVVSPVSTADLSTFVGKPVLLAAYGVSDNMVTVHEVEEDSFVSGHLSSYKKACGAAFDQF